MPGRPQRNDSKRALAAAVAVTAAASLVAACGSTGAARSQSLAATAMERDGPQASVASSSGVPKLDEDGTLTVRIPGDRALDEPPAEARVTLTGLAQAARTPQGEFLEPETAEPGTTFVCLEFKVENTGGVEFDTGPLTRARWTGEDGETTEADVQLSGSCQALGMVPDSLLVEPHPRPGEFVRGTTLLMVPDGRPGVLEFADAVGRPLFEVATTASR